MFAQESVMDIKKEREAFVENYRKVYKVDKSLFVNDSGEFTDLFCQDAWVMWQAAKAQALSEEKGRSDFEIIAQTIELVDLIAGSNRFQRDKSTPFPFESNNPRNIEWWRLACKIQELLTDTDPDNCDFDEYKAMIEAQEQSHE